MIETIIFDLDGTLIDSSCIITQAFNDALSPFGISLSHHEVDAMRTQTANELFLDRLSKEDARHALERLWDFSSRFAPKTLLIPGIVPILERITAKGITLGLWTGRDKTSTMHILNFHQIAIYFKEIVAGCEVSNNKPHPEGLLLLAKRLNKALTSMIHVGDHEHDLIGANAAGVKPIYANWLYENPMHHPLAHMSFTTLAEFEHWLNL